MTTPLLKATLLPAVYEQRESTLRRVATMSDAEWEPLCPPPRAPRGVIRLDVPRRRVRDIVAHLITVDETALRGGTLRSWAGIRRLESDNSWDPGRITDLANRPITELVTLLARRGERFARLAAAAPSGPRLPAMSRSWSHSCSTRRATMCTMGWRP